MIDSLANVSIKHGEIAVVIESGVVFDALPGELHTLDDMLCKYAFVFVGEQTTPITFILLAPAIDGTVTRLQLPGEEQL